MSSVAGIGLQQHAGDVQDLGAQVARGEIDGLAADGGAARAVGAAAIGHGVGVAGEHAHAFHGHAERRGGDLAHDGVGALALLGDADRADDAAVGLELDDAGVLQRDRRAADAVVALRPRRGALDEGGDADAAMDALLAQPRLLGAQPGVVHALHQRLDAALVRHVLDLDAAGGDGGIGVVGEHVAAADLDGVDTERGGGAVDQVLADGVADRMADGAVLRGRQLVEIDHGGARPVVLVACRGRP